MRPRGNVDQPQLFADQPRLGGCVEVIEDQNKSRGIVDYSISCMISSNLVTRAFAQLLTWHGRSSPVILDRKDLHCTELVVAPGEELCWARYFSWVFEICKCSLKEGNRYDCVYITVEMRSSASTSVDLFNTSTIYIHRLVREQHNSVCLCQGEMLEKRKALRNTS